MSSPPPTSPPSNPAPATGTAATPVTPSAGQASPFFTLNPQVQHVMAVSAQQWSGPIPPPDALEKYEQIIPGSATRLLEMTEREQGHRHQMDQKVLGANAGAVQRGQYLGTVIGVLAVGGAIAIATTAPWVAAALVSVPVGSIVQAIVKGRPDKTAK